jgi:ArsR family transcriptional regulator, arsenate/arsenite/antimonite-responsive transcriptional repressor
VIPRVSFVMPRSTRVSTRSRSVSAKQLVAAAKAIGHPARLRILAMLEGRAMCVCQMTSILALAPSTVSGHLNELRRSGLVVEDKQGKLVFYRLDSGSVFADLVAQALAHVEDDEIVESDRAIVDRVQAVPIEVLTGAGMDLRRVGITRPRRSRSSA